MVRARLCYQLAGVWTTLRFVVYRIFDRSLYVVDDHSGDVGTNIELRNR